MFLLPFMLKQKQKNRKKEKMETLIKSTSWSGF